MNVQSNSMQIYSNSSIVNVQKSHVVQNTQNDASSLNNSGKTDSVDFSNAARLLAEANRIAMQGTETDATRSDKVARLKGEVQSGTYQANERGIAEGLAREEILLFQA